MNQQSRLSVSSWSLHRTLGKPPFFGAADEPAPWTPPVDAVSLLELPARVSAFGIKTMEMCHFHLPRRDDAYLRELRSALEESGVELWSLLIDDGDLTHIENGGRDLEWIRRWINVARTLGARNARVIAGKAEPTPENLQRSREHVLWLLDETEGQMGLCADFGNWSGPDKYAKLAKILPRADSLHVKCRFSGAPASVETMERDDFTRCLDLVRQANFNGPYTLIYDGEDADEWRGLALEREEVTKYL